MSSIYIVAGEASGDLLGANLLKNLSLVKATGIGGNLMQKEGFLSLFDMNEISVMGFSKILFNANKFLQRIDETASHILDTNPDVLVTIDSPGFCFRLIKKLKSNGFKKPSIHYVAPSVWAWKSYRAKEITKFVDHLMCLFPFEPKYFNGIPVSFVGHPVYKTYLNQKAKKSEKNEFLILPGSRDQEIKTHLPIFLKAVDLMDDLGLKKKIVTIPCKKDLVEKIIKNRNIEISLDNDFSKGSLALACNGTVTLELAAYNVPMVSAYKISWPLYYILKNIVQTPFINLVNIISGKKIVEEIIQCSPKSLSHSLNNVKKCNYNDIMENLRGDIDPSEVILSYL